MGKTSDDIRLHTADRRAEGHRGEASLTLEGTVRHPRESLTLDA